MNTNTKIAEFFNFSTKNEIVDWQKVIAGQQCGYLNKKCIKVRKSEPSISIGTCTVLYARATFLPRLTISFSKKTKNFPTLLK